MPYEIRNETIELEDYIPHPANYNRRPDEQIGRLAMSLEMFGQPESVTVWDHPHTDDTGQQRRGYFIAGHGVREAASQLTWKQLRADILPADYPEELALAYIPAANRLAQLSDPDDIALARLLDSAKAHDEDLLEAIGYSEDEFQALLSSAGMGQEMAGTDTDPEISRADELREQWQTETGQLWQLGPHRVICGDCTDRDVVDRLMDGERADCVVTDPPYGVDIDYSDFDDSGEAVKSLVSGFMPILLGMGCPILLTPGIPAMWHYPRPSWLLGWIHPAATSSGPWGFVSLNPILAYGKDPYLSNGLGRRQGYIEMVSEARGDEDHPVQKPLNVWEQVLMRASIVEHDTVYDPFLGSGTTLIAAQNLNRICYGCEISPAYVAVILQRFRDHSNIEPKLID